MLKLAQEVAYLGFAIGVSVVRGTVVLYIRISCSYSIYIGIYLVFPYCLAAWL
jgi:hypothetical protein